MADRPELCALGEMPELGVVPEKMHAFAVRQDRVIITADRTTRDLDRSEVVEMIERVAAYADKFDDELVEEFGGTRYTDRPLGKSS